MKEREAALLEPPDMAKKQGDISVKISPEAYRLARSAAGWRNMKLAKYLSEAVKTIANRDLDRMERDRKRQEQEEAE